MKNMKLQNKIIIPVGAILIVLVVTLTLFVLTQVQNLADDMKEERIEGMSMAVEAMLGDFRERTRLTAMAVAAHYNITTNLVNWNAENDREGSRQNLISFLTEQTREMGVDSFVVRDFEGRIVLRLHDLASYYDIDGSPAGNAALEGRTTTSFSSTATMPMGLNTTVPILYSGEIIGTMTPLFFLHTDAFVDYFAQSLNAQVTIFGGAGATTRVATTLVDNGDRIIGTELDDPMVIDTAINQGQKFVGDTNLLGLPYSVVYLPLLGAGGNVVGLFFVGFSNETIVTYTNMLVTTFIIIGVAVFVVALFVIILIARSISNPLKVFEEWMHETASKGNVEWSEEEGRILDAYKNRKDEVGMLFRSYVQLTEFIGVVRDELKEVAGGNLSIDVTVRGKQDILSKSLKDMVENLSIMFRDISDSATQVTEGSEQISQVSTILSKGSVEQSATVEQLSSSISEIAEITATNAEMSTKASTLAGSIMNSAENGNKQMNEMVKAVEAISEASQSISKVIKVIDDIAFQTNILALNAAVEAARAGQHGKGFAVVAEEVRNLAAKSAEAAKDTGDLISDSMEKAKYGAEIAQSTAESLTAIVSGITESSEVVSKIATASEAQATGIDQIKEGINMVAKIAHENGATAEESAASSTEFNAQAHMLGELISKFTIKEQDMKAIASAILPIEEESA
ncbi:MAG: methyl-accepting chemotaxis protein [Oscillospiraceae bacterium]|nr:methyl-accepting chemotaxis protein [Oscillospiraceae bacterium]